MEKIRDIPKEKIVHSDETGIDDNEVPLTGWARRGKRCYAVKNAKRTTRYNITAALNNGKLFAPFLFEGYSNTLTYMTYVREVLVPELQPGMVVIIDNASFHKAKVITTMIEAVGCTVEFLPPYSPDLNPIEHYWTPLKHAIRKAAEGSADFYQVAVNVIGEMCAT